MLRDAATKNLAQIAHEIADLAARTRDNKLKPDELAGGTFTLTNTGSRGALFDTPVVFLPQSAILGTGVVVKRPGVVSVDGKDAISVRSYVYLALSYDHRVIDGADAARFLERREGAPRGGRVRGPARHLSDPPLRLLRDVHVAKQPSVVVEHDTTS